MSSSRPNRASPDRARSPREQRETHAPREPLPSLTYRDAGVDLVAAADVKEVIKRLAATTRTARVAGPAGFFAGAYEFPPGGDTLLVASTDSVGTKVKIAAALGRYRGLGIDSVNQNVNDVLATGGEPLFFLDYIGTGKLDPSVIEDIVDGIADGCRAAGCALIGGETAELPGMYGPGELELVGFVVGVVAKDALLTGQGAKPGDVLVGLPSSGPHTNGFSLIRKVFDTDRTADQILERPDELGGRSIADALLEPHIGYLPRLKPVLGDLLGLAHITGGGFFKNVPRSLPERLAAEIDRSTWEIPAIFKLIQARGRIADEEMFRVFNMGVGMIAVVAESKADRILASIPAAWELGRVIARHGDARVVIK